MKKAVILVTLLTIASVAGGMNQPVIDRNDLSIKAGPTQPGEVVSLVWLEAYVYPKTVKTERVISLGVRTTSSLRSVTASFDFSKKTVRLSSNDGLNWSTAYMIPQGVASGFHVVRYIISGRKGSITRTVDFDLEDSAGLTAQEPGVSRGEAVYVESWPLTVTANCAAMVDGTTRILVSGEKLIGITKSPWYKVVFADGEEGWVSAAYVREPLEEYFRLGYESYLRKDYATAIDYYQNVTNMEPDYVKGHYWLAKSHYAKGDTDAAYRSIIEALRVDERNIDSRVLAAELARSYFKEAQAKFRAKRHNESAAAYQKVIALNSESALSWTELGKSYRELGMPLEARAAWREALKIEPDNKELHALLFIDVGGSRPVMLAKAKRSHVVSKAPAKVLIKTRTTKDMPAVIADDSLKIVRASKTKKGTGIEAAVRSVVALTKSLGTPVVEKGWQTKKQGNKFFVSYLCEQGSGALEAFEWMVDVDTKKVSAVNANSRLIMDRW